jgi:hypothetical protein
MKCDFLVSNVAYKRVNYLCRYAEVAAAYVESLRNSPLNLTRGEIVEKVANAVNVRFIVSVLLVLRQQISVNGGDILRNIFSLTL